MWVKPNGGLTLIDTRKIKERHIIHENLDTGFIQDLKLSDKKDQFNNRFFSLEELNERNVVIWNKHIDSFKYDEISEDKKYFHKYTLKPICSHKNNGYYRPYEK